MKYLITISAFMFMSVSLLAPDAAADRKYIIVDKEAESFRMLWEALKMVESSNNPYAINHTEQAYGVSQIRQIRLDDYYKRTGTRYTLEDCLHEDVSLEIFRYYYERFDDWELAVRRWNGSGPKTFTYLGKIKQELSKGEIT